MFGVAKTDSGESGLYSIPWGESRLTANDKLFFLSVRELADYVGNYCEHQDWRQQTPRRVRACGGSVLLTPALVTIRARSTATVKWSIAS